MGAASYLMFDLSQLKICFIAGTLGQGGAERQLFYILKALRQSNASLRLLCLTRGEFWEEKVRELGIPVTWVGHQASRLARLGAIISALRRQPPDILQSQHFYTNLYVVAAARALGIWEVGAIRNDGVSEVRDNGRVAGYLSLRAPRMIIANSQAGIRNAVALGVPVARLHLLANVVDTDYFRPAIRPGRNGIRLMAAGRLTEQKRLDRFLTLVAHIRRLAGVAIKAVIIGEGPQRAQLTQQATELGLFPDVVEFRGIVPDVTMVYREADIFVLTSDWEGTPNVALEAMASGLPVVATRVGGVPDVIQHGQTGFLADSGDEGAMIEALLKLVSNVDLRMQMGARARAYVEDCHSPRRLPPLLTNIYKQAFS